MSHWLDKVIKLLTAKTHNLRELASLADADPKTFYRDVDMSGVDVRGQDLRGMEFNSNFYSEAIWDETTVFDTDFDDDLDDDIEEFDGLLHKETADSCDAIGKLRKHEERLACIINLCINNIEEIPEIAKYYSDKSTYVNDMLSILSSKNFHEIDLFGKNLNEREFSIFISFIFNSCYYHSRPLLLYYMSKHLGYRKDVLKIVTTKLKYMELTRENRSDITDFLRNWIRKPDEYLKAARYSDMLAIHNSAG